MTSTGRSLVFVIPLLVLSACPRDGARRPDPTPRPSESPASAFEVEPLSEGLPATPSWGVAWDDTTGDGLPELLVGRHKRHAWLFANESGRLEKLEVPELAEPAPGKSYYDRHNCAWGEANGDGWADLFCVSGAEGGLGEGPNRLLVASGDGLRDATPESLSDELGRGRSVNWLDFDSDDDLDLFVGNEERAGHPNALYVNSGGAFERRDVGVETTMATVSSTAADWDLDGDPDLTVLGHGFSGSHMYENDGGVFREVEHKPVSGGEWLAADWADYDHDADLDMLLTGRKRLLVLENRGPRFRPAAKIPMRAARAAIWLDVENDGDADVFVVQGRLGTPPLDDPPIPGSVDAEDFLILNEDGRFVISESFEVPGDGANGEAVAATDFDRDGRVDLALTNGYLDDRGMVMLARNTTTGNESAALALDGPPSNPHGIGASVHVLAEPSWVVPVTDGVVSRGQSETGRVVIGLGHQTEIEVRIEWPDGTRDCLTVRGGEALPVPVGSSPC